MKISQDIRIPEVNNPNFLISLVKNFSEIIKQLNNLTEGRLSAKHNAVNSVPTTGEFSVGDFVPKIDIIEQGVIGSKYIITGWVCVASPNTFVQNRILTGN